MLPLFGDGKPTPFLQTEFNDGWAKLSPDGRWIAYVSDESGREQVYVQSFPEHGGKWQISNGGGEQPLWRRDGRELFYLSGDRKLMAVEVKGDANKFEAGFLSHYSVLTSVLSLGTDTMPSVTTVSVFSSTTRLGKPPLRQLPWS